MPEISNELRTHAANTSGTLNVSRYWPASSCVITAPPIDAMTAFTFTT